MEVLTEDMITRWIPPHLPARVAAALLSTRIDN